MIKLENGKYSVQIFKQDGCFFVLRCYEDRVCSGNESTHYTTEAGAIRGAKKFLATCHLPVWERIKMKAKKTKAA